MLTGRIDKSPRDLSRRSSSPLRHQRLRLIACTRPSLLQGSWTKAPEQFTVAAALPEWPAHAAPSGRSPSPRSPFEARPALLNPR